MKIDIKHLAQLSVIVEAGSFQAAADQLGLTQPVLSRNMGNLEAAIGVSVFRREGRRSVPNALGLKLARSGLAIRFSKEQAENVAVKMAKGTLGELRIGAPPMTSGRFLTRPLTQFIQENPDCNVVLKTGLLHELRSMLERGQVDIIVGPKNLIDPSEKLEFEQLVNDRVGVLCRHKHPLTALNKITAKNLEAQSWVAHSQGSMLRQQTEAALVSSGVRSFKIGFETDSIRTVLEIVADTDLISSMPRAATAPYLEDRLVFLPFDHPQFARPMGIIRRKDTAINPTEKIFLGLIRGKL